MVALTESIEHDFTEAIRSIEKQKVVEYGHLDTMETTDWLFDQAPNVAALTA
jgi:hypothetical protein